jgi:hypothetical protein
MTLEQAYFDHYDYFLKVAMRLARDYSYEDLMQDLWIRIKMYGSKAYTSPKSIVYKMLHDCAVIYRSKFGSVVDFSSSRKYTLKDNKYSKDVRPVNQDFEDVYSVEVDYDSALYAKQLNKVYMGARKNLSARHKYILDMYLQDIDELQFKKIMNTKKNIMHFHINQFKNKLREMECILNL